MRKISTSEFIIFAVVLLLFLVVLSGISAVKKTAQVPESNATMNATDNVTVNYKNKSAEINTTGVFKSECIDSDNSADNYVKGVAKESEESFADACLNEGWLTEYFCDNRKVRSLNMDCWSGFSCIDGACTDTDTICTDSDGGQNVSILGYVTRGEVQRRDYCADAAVALEYFCNSNGAVSSDLFECAAGTACSDGACITPSIIAGNQ